jgi:hypothetical protein
MFMGHKETAMFRTMLLCTVSAFAVACATGPDSRTDANSAANAKQPITCVKSGSRVLTENDPCSNLPGRSYSHDDIDRTGQTNAADALQMLDPSVTVQHH